MKDKTLRAILFGDTAKLTKPTERSQKLEIPAAKYGEKYRRYEYRKDDGFILTLIEMIERLEDRVSALESKKRK